MRIVLVSVNAAVYVAVLAGTAVSWIMWRVHVCTGVVVCAAAQLFLVMLGVRGVSFALLGDAAAVGCCFVCIDTMRTLSCHDPIAQEVPGKAVVGEMPGEGAGAAHRWQDQALRHLRVRWNVCVKGEEQSAGAAAMRASALCSACQGLGASEWLLYWRHVAQLCTLYG
jgi:hypothetical protein